MEKFKLNTQEVEVPKDLTRRLLDVIRVDQGLTGTKESCQEGECGACMVLIDDEIYNSCLVPVGNVIGKSVETIEQFKEREIYKRIEEAFVKAGAVQCGFCTPGMVMATYALLKTGEKHSLEDVKLALSGNLCRCTGYQTIFKAVQLLQEEVE
ncbi:(2Fe-2S)-binding protein [Fusibacter tunisiensis]|uniref:Carbon-monoxide dehydrogenase small subunit n=1 Tax=Fusibacter tunisiensis TaxID=1008308 RepID=A0ABS2MQQ7_9FIRM|nr:(2Fe-2S)-binding protein [Fusibacter tunisiensis]MBM7561733.1 carbon-monoxide dehydrogenase small subunit [Fusibacter tunisiensis]